MNRWIVGIFFLPLCALAHAKEYGHYEVSKVISVSGIETGKPSATVNLVYFSQILDDLGSHASIWPPQFDSIDDRHRAEHDVYLLSNMLDPVADNFSHSTPMLLRLGMLHGFGHNLDIPGSSEKAEAVFTKLLEQSPDDPQANFQFGKFYALTLKRANAIPYLEKAKALGVSNADFWLGMTYTSLGENAKAIDNLTSYTTRVPTDTNAAKMLDAVKHGKVEMKQGIPPPGTSP